MPSSCQQVEAKRHGTAIVCVFLPPPPPPCIGLVSLCIKQTCAICQYRVSAYVLAQCATRLRESTSLDRGGVGGRGGMLYSISTHLRVANFSWTWMALWVNNSEIIFIDFWNHLISGKNIASWVKTWTLLACSCCFSREKKKHIRMPAVGHPDPSGHQPPAGSSHGSLLASDTSLYHQSVHRGGGFPVCRKRVGADAAVRKPTQGRYTSGSVLSDVSTETEL